MPYHTFFIISTRIVRVKNEVPDVRIKQSPAVAKKPLKSIRQVNHLASPVSKFTQIPSLMYNQVTHDFVHMPLTLCGQALHRLW